MATVTNNYTFTVVEIWIMKSFKLYYKLWGTSSALCFVHTKADKLTNLSILVRPSKDAIK